MAKKTPAPKQAPTKESMRIAAAIRASDMTVEAIGAKVGVSGGAVSQWAGAFRPVPAEKAAALAVVLGLKPEEVSASYARVAASASEAGVAFGEPSEGIRPDLEASRLQNDIHAINLALGTLAVSMAYHRPAEAKDVAVAMRKKIPKKFRDRGLIRELLTILDQA